MVRNEYPYYRYIGDRPNATVAASFAANRVSMPSPAASRRGRSRVGIRPVRVVPVVLRVLR